MFELNPSPTQIIAVFIIAFIMTCFLYFRYERNTETLEGEPIYVRVLLIFVIIVFILIVMTEIAGEILS